MSPADVCEAADVAEDFAKLIRSLPGNSECADAAAAVSADGSAVRVIGDVV